MTVKRSARQLYDERRRDIARVLDWIELELDKHKINAKANCIVRGCWESVA